jgi:hypothetical protein
MMKIMIIITRLNFTQKIMIATSSTFRKGGAKHLQTFF